MSGESAVPTMPGADAGASLRVVSGPSLETGTEIVLIDARITLGSDPAKASVVLANDIKISRLHAFIQREGDAYMLYDAESVSGTLVNGQAIARGHPLMPGDRVQMGDTAMVFTLRRAWSSQAASAKGLVGEGAAILVILLVVAGSLLAFGRSEKDTVDVGDWNVDVSKTMVPRDGNGNVDWTVASFVEDLEMDQERAKMHYRRGMRCHDDMALDPANAYTAILELRRAKAYCWKIAGKTDLGFQLEKIDQAIAECQKYLKHQKERYVTGYVYAKGIGDSRQKEDCLRRLAGLFRDRFGDGRCADRTLYETALAKLETGG